jgi:hypothetical protein
MTVVVHHRDGSEKNRIPVTKKAVVVGMAMLFLGFIALTDGPAQLEQMQRRNDAAELRPTMEKLADDGNEAASLWLVKNYFSENKLRLAQLAAQGNVEAMYVQGRLKIASRHVDEGQRLIAAAAAKGYAPAIQDINRRR